MRFPDQTFDQCAIHQGAGHRIRPTKTPKVCLADIFEQPKLPISSGFIEGFVGSCNAGKQDKLDLSGIPLS